MPCHGNKVRKSEKTGLIHMGAQASVIGRKKLADLQPTLDVLELLVAGLNMRRGFGGRLRI